MNIHHLISDGWTLGLVCRKIMNSYSNIINSNTDENDLEFSYINYIEDEKNYINSEKFNKDKAFWNEMFETIPEVATFPSMKQETKEISCGAKRKLFILV